MQWEQSSELSTLIAIPVATKSIRSWREWLKLVVVLFKLRIVSLLLLAAYGGAVLGSLATETRSWQAWLVLTIAGIFSAAGASAINQYLERERDTTMQRTAKRPLALGEITNPQLILWIGISMIVGATLISLLINTALAVWVLAGAITYVGVYTIWLKPRTILNIVIGGFAGSCAVLSGGAALGSWSHPTVLLLAILLFAWTPVHFWALALAYKDDYARADYPMLPTFISPKATAYWTALHTILTVLSGMAIGLFSLDLLYLFVTGLVSFQFLRRTKQMWCQPERKTALALFHTSNLYLALVLVTLLLSPIWR